MAYLQQVVGQKWTLFFRIYSIFAVLAYLTPLSSAFSVAAPSVSPSFPAIPDITKKAKTSTTVLSSVMSNRVRSTATTLLSSSSSCEEVTQLPVDESSQPKLPSRILETLDPCVVLMKELIGRYANLWEDKGGIFSLAQGVVYWDPPKSCQEALQEEISKGFDTNLLHTYGPAQGIPELVTKLQEKIVNENGLRNHDVMVTVGANQAYVNCVLTCLNEHSQSIVFAPYYFNHVMAIQMCCNGDSSVVIGPCTDDGIPNLDWLERTLQQQSEQQQQQQQRSSNEKKKIDMVTIVNPGNPTGVSLSRGTLQRAVDICRQYNVWLVLDCTYEYFTLQEEDQPIPTFPNDPHVIHIFSFSKSYALAGFRCGYVCLSKDAPSSLSSSSSTSPSASSQSSLLSNMLKVQDTLPICPPRISQIAALGALNAGKDWVREKFDTLQPSRDIIKDALSPLKGSIMGSSGAMYLMAHLPPPSTALPSSPNKKLKVNGSEPSSSSTSSVKEQIEECDDVEVCRRLVQEYGIAIIPGTYCGFPGWIRVCYANLPPDKCQEAAKRLKDGLTNILLDS